DWLRFERGFSLERALCRRHHFHARPLGYDWLGIGYLVRFFEVKIDHVLCLTRLDPEILCHVDKGVALIVCHSIAVQSAETKNPHEILFWIKRCATTRPRSRMGRNRLRPFRPAVRELGLDI